MPEVVFNCMLSVKLYPILFESEKQIFSYTPPTFALFQIDATVLSLVHVPSLIKHIKDGPKQSEGAMAVIAGMISLRDSGDKCLTAFQVEYIAGSPKYPGAGITMYALASKHLGGPLTSDRNHSSSVAARETWAKIETDGNWKMAGTGLDNYAIVKHPLFNQINNKTYIDIKGKYPNRTTSWNKDNPSTPRTPEEIDDCPLPTKYGDVKDLDQIANIVGTANAYTYTGPLQPEPLIKHGQEVLQKLTGSLANPRNEDALTVITRLSEELFQLRYNQGSDTPR